MRKGLLLSTGIAVAFASPAYAESWYLVGEGEKDLFFADADTLSRNGSYLQMTVIDSFEDPIASDGSNLYYLRGPVNFDCSSRQFQNLDKAALDYDHAHVTDIEGDSTWQSIGTGTYAEALFQFACDGARRDTPLSDPFGYAEDYWYYYYDY